MFYRTTGPLLLLVIANAASFQLHVPKTAHNPTTLLESSTNSVGPKSFIAESRSPNRNINTKLYSSNEKTNDSLPPTSSTESLNETFGGYTVKQRLREEVESPFRKVRLIFFLGSFGSALTALYFSAISVLKANMYTDASVPMDQALESCAINVAAAVVCGALAYRDYNIGQANLARIAKGGKLAKLAVTRANLPASSSAGRASLADFRRVSRVVIAAGGKNYINQMARSLNADQLTDENNIPQRLAAEDVIVVPVLLEGGGSKVGDTRTFWRETVPREGTDRNFDLDRANEILAFPNGNMDWFEYLESEVETAKKQGFDVVEKGITITVKKNGRILRRATGQPQWENFIGAMEVLDSSKFGMPGDSEKYGGP